MTWDSPARKLVKRINNCLKVLAFFWYIQSRQSGHKQLAGYLANRWISTPNLNHSNAEFTFHHSLLVFTIFTLPIFRIAHLQLFIKTFSQKTAPSWWQNTVTVIVNYNRYSSKRGSIYSHTCRRGKLIPVGIGWGNFILSGMVVGSGGGFGDS